MANASSGAVSGSTSIGIYERNMLDGFVDYLQPSRIRQICRDIYDFDPIAGQVVDTISELPFSDFELSGLSDKNMRDTYADGLNGIGIKGMFPEMTRNYLVEGAFIGYINEDKEDDAYTSILPMYIENCTLTPLPFYGRDPLIDVTIPQQLRRQANSTDQRIRNEYDKYGDTLKEMLSRKSFPLDPKYTVYFSRRTLSTVIEGTPYYKRIIPVWLIEKALMRGTIDLAHRRQKALLHLLIGDDEWIPDEAVLAQYVDLIRRADQDPVGAIIATRPQVQTNEIRSGSDFWRVDEISDWATTQKMRGLGVSESLLSSDLSVDTTATALSIFLDQLRSYRDMATRRILYNKILLLIAIKNDFTVSRNKEVITGELKTKLSQDEKALANIMELLGDTRVISGPDVISLDNQKYKISDYILPKIQWHKALRPEGNSEIMTSLTTLEEKGLPIPLRIWSAAAGVSVAEVVRGWPDDIILRKKAQQYKSQLPVDPKQQVADMFGGGGEESEASLAATLANIRENSPRKPYRKFDHLEMRDPDTRKLLSVKGRKVVNERANKIAAEAIQKVFQIENAKTKSKSPEVEKRYYHNRRVNNSPIFGSLS